MSEEHTETTTGQTTSEERVETTAEQTAEELKYSQKDFDNILAKKTATLERKIKAAEEAAEAARKKGMSEQEQAIESARKEGAAKAAAEWRVKSIQAGLVGAGFDAERAVAAASLAPSDVEDPAEAIAAIRDKWPELFAPKGKQPAKGGELPNGQKTLGEGEWTDDRIDAVIRSGQYVKYRDQIEKARLEKVRKSGMLTP